MQLNYGIIGQNIQKIRKRKRISQNTLASMIDKSSGYISYIEHGKKTMSLATFVSIANALDVSTEELLCRQRPITPEVANRELQKLFSNCTNYETDILLDILKATKDALKAHRYLLAERH